MVHFRETAVDIPGDIRHQRYFSRNSEVRSRDKIDWSRLIQNIRFTINDTDGAHAFTDSVGPNLSFLSRTKVFDPDDSASRFSSITLGKHHLVVLMATGPKRLTVAGKCARALELSHEVPFQLLKLSG